MERTTSKFLSCAPGWMVAPLVGWRKDGKLAVVGSGGGGTACIPEFYCGHVRLGDIQAERQSR